MARRWSPAARRPAAPGTSTTPRSEEHTSELQSRRDLVCRLLLDTATTALYTLSLHDALPILGERMSQMPVGNGLEPEVKVGPVINRSARDKIAGLVEAAVDHGAKVVTGGKAPSRPGYFYDPKIGRAHV